MKEQRRKRARLGIAPQGGKAEGRVVFQVVAAYEDGASRDRALQLYHRIERKLQPGYRFESTWWRFDHLREDSLREQAADEAAAANMIILSLRAAAELPRGTRGWIDSWLRRRRLQKAALVALVAGRKPAIETEAALLPVIENVAREAQMDLFLHWVEARADANGATLTNGASAVAPDTSQTPPAKFSRQPTPHWGINE